MSEHKVHFVVDNKTWATLRFALKTGPLNTGIWDNQDTIPPNTRKNLEFHRTTTRNDLSDGYLTWMQIVDDRHKELRVLTRPDFHGSHFIDLAAANIAMDVTYTYTVANLEGQMADIQVQLGYNTAHGRV